jgi:hypothetical protein
MERLMDPEIEAVADAIDAARYAHPEYPRERDRPFSEADDSDREYARRLATAAVEALNRQRGATITEICRNEKCPRGGTPVEVIHR